MGPTKLALIAPILNVALILFGRRATSTCA
jgi:hypothetical protein